MNNVVFQLVAELLAAPELATLLCEHGQHYLNSCVRPQTDSMHLHSAKI